MRFLILVLSLVLMPAGHAAMLKGTNGVELLAIDGQKVNAGMLSNKNIELTDGQHQIVVQYAKRINQKNMVYSRPTIFSINIVGDTEIKVRNFRDVNHAESAIRKGLTWIIDNGKNVTKVNDGEELFEEGFQLKPDLEKLIYKYNQKNGLVLPGTFENDNRTEKNIQTNNKTQQLIAIYRASSLEEKKAFRMWLLEQDIK